MRTKAAFTVFPRTLRTGRVVFYYQCYDKDGRRIGAHSTGQVKKTLAVAYCMELYRAGKLVPVPRAPTFGEYAKDWWTDKCLYLQWRRLRTEIVEATIKKNRGDLVHYLVPYFGKMPLDRITAADIEGWLVFLRGTKNMAGRLFKESTINKLLDCLRVMLNEAVRRGLIPVSPAEKVSDLKEEAKHVEIFKLDEARRLFPAEWGRIWESYVFYALNKLAAYTGMRIGELLGLRGGCVCDNYVHVAGQYTQAGRFEATKTKTCRDIPITPIIRAELEELIARNGAGYVFSEDGGATPVNRMRVKLAYDGALAKIGIDEGERRRRGLSMHAWRHFLNTRLRMANVPDSKVQEITGHNSQKMTEHYTHFDSREFEEVREVQARMLGGQEAGGDGAAADGSGTI
jgi:integrase